MSAQRVDVLSLLAELPELMQVAVGTPFDKRLFDVCTRIREANNAVRDLVEASERVRDAYWQRFGRKDEPLYGPIDREAESLRAALERFGGTP